MNPSDDVEADVELGSGLVAVAIVVAISASRVVLTVQHVSDVIGGVILGATFVLASSPAFQRRDRQRTLTSASAPRLPSRPNGAGRRSLE